MKLYDRICTAIGRPIVAQLESKGFSFVPTDEYLRLQNEAKHWKACYESQEVGVKFYREETTRLTLKCDAICSTIRRLKNRGHVTMEMHPVRNF